MDGDELNLKNMDIEIILAADSKKKNVLVVRPKGEKAWIYELDIKEANLTTIVINGQLNIKAKVIDAYTYMIGKI